MVLAVFLVLGLVLLPSLVSRLISRASDGGSR
jgi:hypothetical protein